MTGRCVQFYSSDGDEPRHMRVMHVRKGDDDAKIWLHDGSVARVSGVNLRDLSRIVHVLGDNRDMLVEAWDDCFEHRER